MKFCKVLRLKFESCIIVTYMNLSIKSKKISYWFGLVLIVVALVGGSYYIGFSQGVKNPEVFLVKGITNIGDDDVEADFSVFWDAWDNLKGKHYDGEKVSAKDFVYSAIDGLASVFKDPNTILLRQDTGDAEKFSQDISGRFGGIGAEIGLRDEQLIIISPLKKSPAERAGLKPNDKILKIDEYLVAPGITTVDDAVKRIRGPIGTAVVLNVMRDTWVNPKDITITRQEIIVPTVDSEIVDGFLHLKLYNFNEIAPQAFYDAGVNAVLNGAKGVILDLRNNPGGFLQVAIDLAGWFLERGQVVAIEDFRSADDLTFRANGNEAFKDLPVVIIVNQGSASASEILAGALRDNRNVPLVGEKTFGKGSVQELFSLRDGSDLKITVAHWLTPKGTIIDKTGLEPDYKVEFTEKDAEAEKDPQLDKALEIIKSLAR